MRTEYALTTYTLYMSKETNFFSLILLLFTLLTVGWVVTSFRLPQTAYVASLADAGEDFDQAPQLTVLHTYTSGEHIFSGTVDISSCDNFLTSLGISSTSHTGLDLSLGVSSTPACSFDTIISQPFSVSFTPNDNSTPRLERVLINGKEVRFNVREQGSNH